MKAFSGPYFFLSNFYESTGQVQLEGLEADSVESAFQAMKTLDPVLRAKIAASNPKVSKALGRRATLREDWLKVRTQVMHDLLDAKFSNEYLAKRLIGTGNSKLVEYNYWHDNFWGDCTCLKCIHIPGQNYLGRLLMIVRDEVKNKHEKNLYASGW